MKSRTNNYIQIRKINLKQKYYLSKWIIFIFLLKFVSINTILHNPTRNLINYYSEIHLVVQGEGTQYFLSKNYEGIRPFEIILNGKEKIENPWDIGEDRNNITLKFNEEIDDCKEMFSFLENIIEVDLSNFDTSHVTNMSSMFDSCSNLENVNVSNLNTSLVKDMYSLFYGCFNLKSIDLPNFDFSKVTSMAFILCDCSKLENLNLSYINTSSVENMEFLFYGCSNLKSIDLSYFDFSKVTTIYVMFYECSKLENIDLSHMNTSLIENMKFLFYHCSNLKSIDLSNLDFSKVTTMAYMFYGCSNLENINLSYINTSSLKYMDYLFYECSNLKSIDLSNLDFSKVFSIYGMVYGCSNLENIIFSNISTPSLKEMDSLFYGCSNLKSIDLSNFDTSGVTSMYAEFYGCSKLENINLSYINTSLVKNMEFLFYGCKNLKSIDLSYFDFSKVTSIAHMFNNCFVLQNIILPNISTSSLKDTNNLFSSCVLLKSIDLSHFDTSEVTDMSFMFYNCNSMKYLDLSNFKTEKVTNINSMFYYCNSLIYLNIYFFKLNNEVRRTLTFAFLPNYTYFCIKDTDTENILFGPNISNCSHYCFQKNRKLDLINHSCVDLCIKNKILYEYNGVCYNKCPKGTLANNGICEEINCDGNNYNSTECLDKIPEGYYYNPKDELFKKCFYSCKTCNGKGKKFYHNCLECKQNLTFVNDSMYATNCYKKCDYYFYIDDLNNFHCTNNFECPEKYNKLILDKKKCIDKCKNDNIYQYEFENKCIISCPNGTFSEEKDKICIKKESIKNAIFYENKQTDKIEEKIKRVEISPINLITAIKGNFKKDEILLKEGMSTYLDSVINKNILNFRYYIQDFNISEDKEDKIEIIDGVLYQITTTENQKIKNISTLYFPVCESILKDKYKIDKNSPLIILKIDYYPQDSLIPIIAYEIYHPFNKSKLNLQYCNNTKIKFNIPVSINDNELFKYEPNSDYYTDDCFAYSTEKGTDIILKDRKQEFIDKNLYLCETNCNYTGYDKINKQSICVCNISDKMELISEIINNPNKLSNNSKSVFIKLSYSNINAFKCFKNLFSKNGLKKNISSYLIIFFIIQFIISTILFFKSGYYLLEDYIDYILENKEETNENNEGIINDINGIATEGNLSYKNENKKISKQKNDYRHKINIINANINNKLFENQTIDNTYDFKSVIILNPSKVNQEDSKSDKIENNIIIDNNIAKKQNELIKVNQENCNKYIELNSLIYEDAINDDKRTILEYYLFLIKRKNIILYSFYSMNDYNSMIIKSCIFSLSFSINYLINFTFFNEEIIHKIYKLDGKYVVKDFMSKILISFIISYIITRIIQYIVLSERIIYQIKKEISLSSEKDLSKNVKKKLIKKYVLFFVFSFIFLIFCWILFSSFSAVYQNTERIILYNTLISFGMNIFYTFIFNIIPAIIRIYSLSTKSKYMFKLSKILQIL